MRMDCLRVRYALYCLFHRDGYGHARYLKKRNVFHAMGENCFYQSFRLPADAEYIRFGNNVVVASGVDFICHDVIHYMLNGEQASKNGYRTYWDVIDIGDNVVYRREYHYPIRCNCGL